MRLTWDEFSPDAPDALLFTSSHRQKTLLSVFEFSLRSSNALGPIHVGCLSNVSALVTVTFVQFSLFIYIYLIFFLIAMFVMSGCYDFPYFKVYIAECSGRVRSGSAHSRTDHPCG